MHAIYQVKKSRLPQKVRPECINGEPWVQTRAPDPVFFGPKPDPNPWYNLGRLYRTDCSLLGPGCHRLSYAQIFQGNFKFSSEITMKLNSWKDCLMLINTGPRIRILISFTYSIFFKSPNGLIWYCILQRSDSNFIMSILNPAYNYRQNF